MTCQHCGETIDAGEEARLAQFHNECLTRVVFGSAAHQLGECSCNGGVREDPPGMSKRDAARLAFDTMIVLSTGAHAEAKR